VAENRKKLIDVFPLACRAGDFLVAENQNLEVLSALRTIVFEDRHASSPYAKVISQFFVFCNILAL